MINILIPLAGENTFLNSSEYLYPKPLIEINGKTIIERVISNYNDIKEEKQFIFILNAEECKKYNFDYTLELLISNVKIIKLSHMTKGVACSALMAIEYINNEDSLIIANADQIFDDSLEILIHKFDKCDGGVLIFESVHPRWSYVRLNENNLITEAAEKRPLSKHAIAGFYYYKQGKDFIDATMNIIRKGAAINDLFYISSTLNELVLKNKSLFAYKIKQNNYHTFYTPQKIKDYDRRENFIVSNDKRN
ncbi:glycosyltransferase family 2 protein [Sulfurimonas sp.]